MIDAGCPQMNDCVDAANKGIMYEKPTNAGGRGADDVQHTVHQLHDELKHKHGLVQHAAGGVGACKCVWHVCCSTRRCTPTGFMVWCGVALLIFVMRPKWSKRRSATPPQAARRLPL